jgi:hypothetical protein
MKDMKTPRKEYVLSSEIVRISNSISSPIIWSLKDVETHESAPEILILLAEWIKSFVAKPHQQLGRTGPVCPFVPPSLRFNTIWMSVAHIESCSEEQIVDTLRQYLAIYESLEPSRGEAKDFKSLIVAFPSISRELASTLIPVVHGLLKADVVAKGLMLGEFYPDSNSPANHNSTFYPLRSDIPLFVFRQMVPNDFIFLNKASDPLALRAKYIDSYLKWLGPRIPVERLQEALKAIEVTHDVP